MERFQTPTSGLCIGQTVETQLGTGGVPVLVDVFTCRGEIDLITASDLADALADGSEANCKVDLGEVTFMGAAGITVLIGHAEECGRRGGWLLVCNPSRILVRLFEVLDTPRTLLVDRTITEA